MAINYLTFQGRNVADIELKTTQGGIEFISFKLAWNEKYKETDRVCFQRCKAWRNTAVFIDKYFHDKGAEMIVEGHLETETWDDKDGNKRSENVLTVDRAHFCGKRGEGAGRPADPATGGAAAPDDELPF